MYYYLRVDYVVDTTDPVAVLEKKYLGPGPSSFGRQQRLSTITIEARFGGLCPPPGPSLKPPLDRSHYGCSYMSEHNYCPLANTAAYVTNL